MNWPFLKVSIDQHRITKRQTVKAKEYGMRPPCAKFDKDAGKQSYN